MRNLSVALRPLGGLGRCGGEGMRFSSMRAISKLLQDGIVATMRNGQYGNLIGREITIRDDRNLTFAKAKIIAIFENNKTFRKLLLKYSGFGSVEEWEEKAKELHKGKLPRYIVLLKLTERLKVDPLYGFRNAMELIENTV